MCFAAAYFADAGSSEPKYLAVKTPHGLAVRCGVKPADDSSGAVKHLA